MVEFAKSFVKLIAIGLALFFIVLPPRLTVTSRCPMSPGKTLPILLRDEGMRLSIGGHGDRLDYRVLRLFLACV